MSDVQGAPRRFRNIRKQVSMFLLTALVGFVGVVMLVAYKQGMFVQHTDIFFWAPDATGINKGMPVRLYGVPVGTVKEIDFADRGGVQVRLGISTEYLPRVARSSVARVAREGVVGAASIQIVTARGTSDPTPVREGDEIKFIPQKSMTEIVDDMRQLLAPTMDEMRKAFAEMSAPGGDFRKAISATRELFEQLPETTREVRQLVRDTNVAVKRTDAAARQAEAALASVTRLTGQAEQHFPVIAGKLATTLDSLNSTANQVRDTTRANGEALRELLAQAPSVMRSSNELVRDSQEIATAARRTWFLRDYIETPQMRTLPVDSFESFSKK